MNPWWLAAGAVLGLPLVGRAYEWFGERRDSRRHPAPGQFAARLHYNKRGDQGPTVILESGVAASSVSWELVQDRLAPFCRSIAYDRAGFGWSPPRNTPRTIPNLLDEFDDLLKEAHFRPPYLLCGHSFGGLLVQHYAARHPQHVLGLVLVDPLEPMEWHPLSPHQSFRLGKAVMLSRRGATLARFGIVRGALDLFLSGSRTIPQLVARASSGKGVTVTDRIVGELRKLPPHLWPALKTNWSAPRSFTTMADYLERIPAACAEPLDESVLAGMPLVVISAERTAPEVQAAHLRRAGLSAHGKHLIATGSGHWAQLDRPDLVEAGVRWALNQVGLGKPRVSSDHL